VVRDSQGCKKRVGNVIGYAVCHEKVWGHQEPLTRISGRINDVTTTTTTRHDKSSAGGGKDEGGHSDLQQK